MLCKHLVRLRKSEEGGIIILVTFAILVLMAAAGVAFDMSRMQTAKAKLSNCLDTAGLAALAKVATTPSGVSVNDWVVQNVKKYFLADCQSGYLETANVSFNGQNQKNNVSIVLSPSYNTLTLDAIVTQNTSLMPIVGVPQVTISAHSVATRSTKGMELALVLDNTGSMNAAVSSQDSATKIQALKCALAGTAAGGSICTTDKNLITTGLLDILFGGADSAPNLFVGVIPFSNMVQFDLHTTPAAINFINRTSLSNAVGSRACLDARDNSKNSFIDPDVNGDKITFDISEDAPPSLLSSSAYFNILKKSDTGTCPPTPVLFMATSKSAVVSSIKNMVASGDTMLQLGLAWGWRMLSPNWMGKWGSTPVYTVPNTGSTMQLPLPYNTNGMIKAVVFMTDGINNNDNSQDNYSNFTQSGLPLTTKSGTAYADFSYSQLPTPDRLDHLTRDLCDSMKQQGIIIFTIAFGQPVPAQDRDKNGEIKPNVRVNSSTYVDDKLLSYCASNDQPGQHFFLAVSNQALSNAFQQIGGQLSNLLITQ